MNRLNKTESVIFISLMRSLFPKDLHAELILSLMQGSGRVVRWCWVSFQCRGVLLIWIRVGQGPTALTVGAGGGCYGHFFSRLSFVFSFSLSLGDGPI